VIVISSKKELCFRLPPADRGSVVGGRRIFHADPKVLSGGFALPTHSLHHRVLEFDSALLPNGTFHRTTAAIPAFIGIENDGRFSFFRTGIKNIHEADIHTPVTTITNVFVKD
jgi:hypothetical protein